MSNTNYMSEAEYRNYVSSLFVKRREGIEGTLHAAVGLSGESGEILDLVKKSWCYGKVLDRNKMLEEAGDVYHYFTMLCIKMGWTMEDVISNNVEKLNKRYPNGYTDHAAIARKDQQPSA